MNEPVEQDDLKTPWTFKLMVVLVVLYLGWRLVQGVVWLWDAIF
jgi:hypothetical protein